QELLRVVVVAGEDLVEGGDLDALEVGVGRIGHRPAGPPQRRLLAPLAVLLGRAPVDVEAALGIDAAHVDALDGARLRALEARLALQRAVLVIQQLEAAAEARRDVRGHLRVHHRGLGLEEPAQRQGHALDQAEPRDQSVEEAHARPSRIACAATTARAVTNRLSSDAGRSHFQAKPMSWSMRTRGSVPRIHTNRNTRPKVLPRNQMSPATQSKLMYAHSPIRPPTMTLNSTKPRISATHQRVLLRNR